MTQTSYRIYKMISSNELTGPVMALWSVQLRIADIYIIYILYIVRVNFVLITRKESGA